MIITDSLRLETAVEIIENTGNAAFDTDVGKDEVEENSSFFVYVEEGDIRSAETSRSQYVREFVLAFITRENATINAIELIENLKKAGLHFKSTETATGKMANTGEEAKMITFIFTRSIRVCK